MRAEIIDLSNHQQFLDPSGKRFHGGILKLSDGWANYTDPNDVGERTADITNQIAEAIQSYFVQGGYHYLRYDIEVPTQVDAYLGATEGRKWHFHCLDVEEINNVFSDAFCWKAHDWINSVEKQTNEPVLLYTNIKGFLELFLKFGHTWVKDKNIWLANYPYTAWLESLREVPYNSRQPYLNHKDMTWLIGKWKIWQYSDKYPGKQEGITGSDLLDVNVWNGSPLRMRSWLTAGIAKKFFLRVSRRYLQPT